MRYLVPSKALTAELSVKFLQVTKGYKRVPRWYNQVTSLAGLTGVAGSLPRARSVSDLGLAGRARLLPLALCGTSGSGIWTEW